MLQLPCADFWKCSIVAADVLDNVAIALRLRLEEKTEAPQCIFSIPCPFSDGFDIEVYADRHGIRGWFGGLEQDFDSVASVMGWVRSALSTDYRLRVLLVGSHPREWQLESTLPASTGLVALASGQPVLLRRLRKTRHVYRQNRLFRSSRGAIFNASAESAPTRARHRPVGLKFASGSRRRHSAQVSSN